MANETKDEDSKKTGECPKCKGNMEVQNNLVQTTMYDQNTKRTIMSDKNPMYIRTECQSCGYTEFYVYRS